jgi:hypothetical protein
MVGFCAMLGVTQRESLGGGVQVAAPPDRRRDGDSDPLRPI